MRITLGPASRSRRARSLLACVLLAPGPLARAAAQSTPALVPAPGSFAEQAMLTPTFPNQGEHAGQPGIPFAPVNAFWDFGHGVGPDGIGSCYIGLHRESGMPKLAFAWHDNSSDILLLLSQASWKSPKHGRTSYAIDMPGLPQKMLSGTLHDGTIGTLFAPRDFVFISQLILMKGYVRISFPQGRDLPWIVRADGFAQAREAFEGCVDSRRRVLAHRGSFFPSWNSIIAGARPD
ncbi:hypothetical protein FHR90_001353 [Endobacter medicaginis]|jgi:hypothetical protein|uniref:Uncharacterized protein n=1 Tax=Endobacter medicaginis TaxID=1181271 RepID=A0A850NTI3_9PROT|nr:hypothetical protein [Endobacter medicaginis]MBB3173530.1 hypothetical protein [Endobacter medicaginis]MCX5475381.1 hypothetical protein [Endobacter medicaginis]NVN30228.1 hypothetical protein [Endobacter medicaginis]